MISQMKKYAFFVHQKDYLAFLTDLQELGIVHTTGEAQGLDPGEVDGALAFVEKIDRTLKGLKARKPAEEVGGEEIAGERPLNGAEIAEEVQNLRERLQDAWRQRAQWQQELENIRPWGNFSLDRIKALEAGGIYLHFFRVKKSQWQPEWTAAYAWEIISEDAAYKYFVIVTRTPGVPEIGVAPLHAPAWEPADLEARLRGIDEKMAGWEARLDGWAQGGIEALWEVRQATLDKLAFDKNLHKGKIACGGALRILEGYVPTFREEKLLALLDQRGILYVAAQPGEEERVPVMLYNSPFSRLFEPISRLFSLPEYGEMDLTPFFAPFFLLFFGFCVGDAGYGLLMLLVAMYLRWKSPSRDRRRIFLLMQFLGIATILFGTLTGTFFGLALAEVPALRLVRERFLDYDQILSLSIVLGIVQILFGLGLQAYRKYRFQGAVYALSSVGWIFLVLSLIDRFYLGYLPAVSTIGIWLALALIVLFSAPVSNWFIRLSRGIWDLYNITGMFGDILSYIRLFALGVSSSILGLVVNNIAWEFGQAPYVGPLIMVLILVAGHAINLFISMLGAFVHPMRLTFVEFYKHAGFAGGGMAYQPFQKHQKTYKR